ncbi:sialidase family protein [Streptomyces sp. ODS28]|uniref:sialidase family protein n=1 Tax=Streptomyces sp. ODS28 TaxID=3136688 RepID=UPI0031E6A47B
MSPARETSGPRGRRRTALGILLFALVAALVAGVSGCSPSGADKGSGTSKQSAAGDDPAGVAGGKAAAGRQLLQKGGGGSGLYPRAIRLQHSGKDNGRVLASTVTFDGDNGLGAIHESTDGGRSFQQVGKIADPAASKGKGQCCGTLYELPRQIGDMKAGTLLWAASPGQDEKGRRMSVRVFKSTDTGRNWSYLSTVAKADNDKGLWEPEFSVDAQGRLVAHYSDETDPAHSQKLMAARSTDGKKWTGHHATVSSTNKPDRPGMAGVRRLPDGTYFMVYEICAPSGKFACVVHYRTSKDGWDWGDPKDLGTRPETADGHYFAHAPTVSWAPEPGNPKGKLMLIGQVEYAKDGQRTPGARSAMWTNSDNGKGAWKPAKAPVSITSDKIDFCPNYSSTLLPGKDGKNVTEIATDYEGKTCKPYAATGPAH